MTLPRFVVDPVPDMTGLSEKEQLQAFMAWTQRQLDRAHDWWPKDSSERVAALEELTTKLKGFWPIVDYSIISFTASSEELATVCDYAELEFDSTTSNVTDLTGNGGVALGSEGQVMVQGMEPLDAIVVWEKLSGSWVAQWTITRPSPADPRTESFGQGVSMNAASTLLTVGCPTNYAGGTFTGALVVLTGSIGSGYSVAQILQAPSLQAGERFGFSSQVSADGLVMVVGAPGTSGTLNRGRVYVYDWNGSSFVYRNYMERSDESGFGWSVGLNEDGSILTVGHASYGDGATGRMEVYDDVSGVFTLRQLIDVPDFVALGLDGQWYDGNNKYFGCYHGISPDARSLLVMGRWRLTTGTWTSPHLFIYKLNTATGLFEFCDLIYDSGWVEEYQASTGFFGGIGFVWGAQAKQVAFNVSAAPYANGRAVGRVYNFVAP